MSCEAYPQAECDRRLKAILGTNFPQVEAEVLFVVRSHASFVGILDHAGHAIAEGTIRRGRTAVFEKSHGAAVLAPGTFEEPGVVAVITLVEVAPAYRSRGLRTAITDRLFSRAAEWGLPAVTYEFQEAVRCGVPI